MGYYGFYEHASIHIILLIKSYFLEQV